MRKVGITTLYHNTINYGGALQAYALQKKIEELGCDCKVIDCYVTTGQSKIDRWKALGFKRAIQILGMKIMYKIKMRFDRKMYNGMQQRRVLFSEFLHEIPHTKPVDVKKIDQYRDEFDICVTGSDQVWHPGIWNEAYLLRFARNKISYAASIGAIGFTSNQAKEMQEALRCN